MAGIWAGLRLAFMGSAEFAVPTLSALAASDHKLVAVYTRPPKPAGRGRHQQSTPVHRWAEDHGIAPHTPKSLRTEDEQEAFAALQVDAGIVVAYGLILPPAILAAPRLGCLNLHPSLLPRWRGAAPIQRALLAGDKVTGVTVMQLDEGLDSGPILLVREHPIDAQATAGRLHDELAALGATAMLEALDGYAAGRLHPHPQAEDGATYADKIDKAETRIDWHREAAAIGRQIRAFSPAPGAWFEAGGRRIKVLAAEIVEGRRAGTPGEILDHRLTVACGRGALRPTRVQRAGRRQMSVDDLLRGLALAAGSRLS